MPLRGTTVKTSGEERLTLLRPMVTRRFELTVDHTLCVGCGTCAKVCPREAISMGEPLVVEGRLVQKPRVDIDDQTCSFCGECVALCPTHALAMTVNGETEIPVVKAQAFPFLVRRVKVNQAPLAALTDTDYIETCPTGAISADVERDAEGTVLAVANVQLDRGLCINCSHCQETAPEGGFEICKPYKGHTRLDVSLCPDGCQACADACPTDAMTYDGNKVVLDERFCLFCGACQAVCPVEGAVITERTGFVHTPVHSAAWSTALEKLVSIKAVRREHDQRGQARRRKLVADALLLGDNGDEP